MGTVLFFFWDGFSGGIGTAVEYLEYTAPLRNLDFAVKPRITDFTANDRTLDYAPKGR